MSSPKEYDWPASVEECYGAARLDGSVKLQAESLLAMRHWFHDLADFDERSGEMLPGALGGVCARALAYSCLEQRAFTKDRLYRIVEHVREPIPEITSRLHERLVREHAFLPIRAVRELDSASFFALSRRPGRTIREKLADKPYLWAVNRRWTVDTAENRLLKALCLRLADLLRTRAECFRESDQPEVAETLATIDSWLQNPVAREIGRWENLPPNNMLLQHRNYRRIWDAWLWTQTVDADMQRDHKNRLEHWMTLLYWSIVSRLSRLTAVRLVEQPCYFDYDAFTSLPAQSTDRNTCSVDGILLPFVPPGCVTGSVSRLGTDKNGRGYGIAVVPDSGPVFFHCKSFRSVGDFERLEMGTLLAFKMRNSGGQHPEATHLVVLEAPKPFRIQMSSRAEIEFSWLGHALMSLANDVGLREGGIRIRMGSEDLSTEASPWGAADIAERIVSTLSPGCANAPSDIPTTPAMAQSSDGTRSVVDLCTLRPRFANGDLVGMLPFRLLWQLWHQPDKEAVEIDLADATAISLHPDVASVSILNLLAGQSGQTAGLLSQAARFFAKKLKDALNTESLTYIVPDATDEFTLDTLRRNVNAAFRFAEPLPRSIAAVLDWHSSSDFQKRALVAGDCVVVLDSVGETLSATPVIAGHKEELERRLPESKGIYWARCPSVQSGSRMTSMELAAEALQKCGCQFPHTVARLCGFQGIIDEGSQVSWRDGEGKWYTAPASQEDVCKKTRFGMDDPWAPLLHGLEQQFRSIEKRARIFIITVGDSFDGVTLERPPSSILEGRDATRLVHCRHAARGGVLLHQWQEMAGDIPLWCDHLPELSMRIVRDGRYARFYLVKDVTLAPKRGRTETIDISETFVLPAGQPHYQFPLLQGSEDNELRYEAFLKSPTFPLKEDVPVALHLTYSYGSDAPYDLLFTPLSGQANEFNSVRAEWRVRSSVSDVAALSPAFPPAQSWDALVRHPSRDSDETSDLLEWVSNGLGRLALRIDALGESERHMGDVCDPWREDKNREFYTFARCNGSRIFCHESDFLDKPDVADVGHGAELNFEIEDGPKGPCARWITGGSSAGPEVANRISSLKVRDMVVSMRKGLRFPFLTIWANGRTLSEANAPGWFREAMQQGVVTLQRLVHLESAADWPPDRQAEIRELVDEALFLLCCLHKDAPVDVVKALASAFQKAGRSTRELLRYSRHIALALGTSELPWQRGLLDSVLGILERDNQSGWSVALQILGIALWRSEGLLGGLKPTEVVQILARVESVLEQDVSAVSGRRDYIQEESLRSHLELVLALLRTRASTDSGASVLLAPGSPSATALARVVDAIIDEVSEHKIPVRSRIQLALEKPAALHNTPDLLFALRLYLTGDSGARAIHVTGVNDDEE